MVSYSDVNIYRINLERQLLNLKMVNADKGCPNSNMSLRTTTGITGLERQSRCLETVRGYCERAEVGLKTRSRMQASSKWDFEGVQGCKGRQNCQETVCKVEKERTGLLML